ncbi:hypothetical protein SAMN06295987_11010 [Novosphingobium mathurense]|uniref:Uncharacterized protein n=2 Tax=Novosphingobium mathurense TaxID=428990 RepID=A0A1U6INF0_9SPHN|nr:hypothetical protein SAMN06295987_11010 [Novosphingobium mathurense]
MGHYTIITVGCGTYCTFSWVGDLRTGKIISFPIGGEDYPELDIKTAPNSRVVIARWTNYEHSDCIARPYAFDGQRFAQISADRRKGSGCYR